MLTDCYNCNGNGAVFVKAAPFCPECKQTGDKCVCGNRDDFIQDIKVVECPVCKGHRQGDLFR